MPQHQYTYSSIDQFSKIHSQNAFHKKNLPLIRISDLDKFNLDLRQL